MPSTDRLSGDEPRVKEDGNLVVVSRRTQRQQRKKHLKSLHKGPGTERRGILDLPYELMIAALIYLCPSDLFRLARTNTLFYALIMEHEVQEELAKGIIKWRYPTLEKCFGVPALLSNIDPDTRSILQSEECSTMLASHKVRFSHIKEPDLNTICSCITCRRRWDALCVVVDFAHWQSYLEDGEPLPMVLPGRNTKWNLKLVDANAAIVTKALYNPLWYACILEGHLRASSAAIIRHSQNKGNKRLHFKLSILDYRKETDMFLDRHGPQWLDFPYNRDQYYMLEAFMPNRAWNDVENHWMYLPIDQHIFDLKYLVSFVERKREERAQAEKDAEEQRAVEEKVARKEVEEEGREEADEEESEDENEIPDFTKLIGVAKGWMWALIGPDSP